MKIHLHHHDLPDGLEWGHAVAIDTETMGLRPDRDRLCLVQLSSGNGEAHLVKFDKPVQQAGPYATHHFAAPNLKKLLANDNILKIFHFARFDLAVLYYYLDVMPTSVYCTKIASRLARTYAPKHSLKDLCVELLGIELSKQQQSSDWGKRPLSEAQQAYAATDVLYLHQLKSRLDEMLEREGRQDLAKACFDFLPARAKLDLMGNWGEVDIFAHS